MEIVQASLAASADAKASDRHVRTALHCAIEKSLVELVQALRAAGADAKQR